MPAKVIDIGEWKKAHGLAATPIEQKSPDPGETTSDVFVNRFMSPDLNACAKSIVIKRPTQ